MVDININDIVLYAAVIKLVFGGYVPFVNFAFEYPPLIILSFILPGVWYFLKNFSILQFTLAFYLQNLVLIYLTAILVNNYRYIRGLWLDVTTLLVLFVMFTVTLGRADLFVCFITIVGFYFLKGKKNVPLGLFLIVLAGFMKIYALLFLPILLIHFWKDKDGSSLKKLLMIFAVFLLVHFLLFSTNPTGFRYLFDYHKNRGFEIESIYAGVLMTLPIQQLHSIFNFGGFNVTFPGVEKFSILPIILELSGIIWLYWKFFKSKYNIWEDTVRFCVLTLIWFITFNKVFSVQFFIWFLPLVRLLNFKEKKQTIINLILILSALAATLVYPYGFYYLSNKRYALGFLISIKNLLVVILFGVIYKSKIGEEVDKRIIAS